MHTFFTILLVFTSWIGFAQADSIDLRKAMVKLEKAFLEKDSAVLSQLLSDDLSFGHSSGWVQAKADVWNDFASGKLEYKKINTKLSAISSINDTWAVARNNADVEGLAGEKEFKLSLHILQLWMKSSKGWQLVARQSTKIN